ncbi:hypothetical protein H5410_021219 [Solanum commersonii]|uniref:Uncharacterized protein n=1 Tax=Solanum commersonii TaxID=4109 RepID=A0A9J5ZBC1_SOLCO|nr:hypothetical protein H5410_021219 [Solanum commersonii]
MPKNKKKASEFRPVKSVIVRGKEVECHNEHINVVLRRPLHYVLPYERLCIVQSLDDSKGWLALMISDTTLRWMDAGAPIEKRDINIASKFCAEVPRDPVNDIEVIRSSTIDIRRIEAEFTREEVDRKRTALADTSPKVPSAFSSSQPTRITQAMILKIGQLAYSTDVRATRLERSIPGMIDSAILVKLIPL